MSDFVLFLCPHNAAKSVIAAAYFDQMAAAAGLSLRAVSAGTEPSAQVVPIVAGLLQGEGFDVSGFQPRHVTDAELQQAHRVISMGCEPADLALASDRLERWDDVPPASQDLAGSSGAIRQHIEQLLTDLKAAGVQ
ncbi:MAG TPA: hypothetical protein VHL11_20395 [Phototrophicaceae bacterium]|jgi:protein-tyrosine-phosphatase|nr:hypothetical protein [Phototrophicaceae bacterium]